MLHRIKDIPRNPRGRIPVHSCWFSIDSPPIFGQSIADLAIRKLTGCTVLAVRREGQLVQRPAIDLPLLPGDEVLVTGTNAQLVFFERAFGLSASAPGRALKTTQKIA